MVKLTRDAGVPMLSVFIAEGELTRDEVLEAYDEFLKRGPTRLVLWDVTAATAARIPTEDVRDLARQLARKENRHSNHGRTAMLCANDVTFGMARMLGTFLEVEGFPGLVAGFRDPKTARAWLTGEINEP